MRTFLRRHNLALTALLVCGFAVTGALAEEAGGGRGGRAGGGRGGRGGGGRGGRMSPDRMWEFMGQRYRDALDVSEEEWKVIEPLAKTVTTKTFAQRMRGFRRNRGGGGGDQSQGMPEADALNKVLENKEASAGQIKEKLAALRVARKAQEAEIKKSRDELRAVLTVRQEALLVMMGLLD